METLLLAQQTSKSMSTSRSTSIPMVLRMKSKWVGKFRFSKLKETALEAQTFIPSEGARACDEAKAKTPKLPDAPDCCAHKKNNLQNCMNHHTACV